MNPTDWAKIEDSLYDYLDDMPRKRRPMPADPNSFLMGATPETGEADDPPWITARYDGCCTTCDEPIFAGTDEIRADGSGGWEGRCCE